MEKAELEEFYGKVWSTNQVTTDFEIVAFCAPFVVAKLRSTGEKGTLQFQDRPRYYFDWRKNE